MWFIREYNFQANVLNMFIKKMPFWSQYLICITQEFLCYSAPIHRLCNGLSHAWCEVFPIIWTNNGLVCWCIYATLGLDELTLNVPGHFLRTMMVWSARFRSRRGKLGVRPISCGAVFAPAPPPLLDHACVNACNDLCWSQFSARLRPRPPAHVWTYL